MNIEGLISVLEANETITNVYFDKNGGWLFVPNNLHPTKKTREEVINAYLQDAPPADNVEEPNADYQQDAPPADNVEEPNADYQQDAPPADNVGKISKKSK